MKRKRQTHAAVALGAMAVFGLSSCIYESDPDDRFYRTLWECDEVPLGPFQADELVLEFMCDGSVRLQCDAFDGSTYGTYETDGQNAFFQNLVMEIEGYEVTFVDASVSWRGSSSGDGSSDGPGYGDTLFLRWRIENSVYPFTTPMHRHTSYN